MHSSRQAHSPSREPTACSRPPVSRYSPGTHRTMVSQQGAKTGPLGECRLQRMFTSPILLFSLSVTFNMTGGGQIWYRLPQPRSIIAVGNFLADTVNSAA